MEVLELALIVLACVIGSAVLCQVVPRLSLPLVQIAVGAVVALAVPAVRDVSISSELFLVLFIACLLYTSGLLRGATGCQECFLATARFPWGVR